GGRCKRNRHRHERPETHLMSAKIVTRSVGDVVVLDIFGNITLGEGSTLLGDVTRDLVARGSKKIILNLAEVVFVDSSGFGTLGVGFTAVTRSGGRLVLMHPAKRIRDFLQFTK